MALPELSFEIPERLFATAESLHLQGAYDLGTLKAGPDDYALDAPVDWSVDITNTGDALLVAGTAAADVTGVCGRCLEPARYSLQGEVEGFYLIPGMEPLEEEGEDDDTQDFEMLGEDHIIDLEPLIVSALLLELPLVPLCKDDCLGLCPRCGADLNEGPCDCRDDEPADDTNPFAILKNYTFD